MVLVTTPIYNHLFSVVVSGCKLPYLCLVAVTMSSQRFSPTTANSNDYCSYCCWESTLNCADDIGGLIRSYDFVWTCPKWHWKPFIMSICAREQTLVSSGPFLRKTGLLDYLLSVCVVCYAGGDLALPPPLSFLNKWIIKWMCIIMVYFALWPAQCLFCYMLTQSNAASKIDVNCHAHLDYICSMHYTVYICIYSHI